jgi:IMP and pyridine-specific 5'-nucleotidase
VCATGQVHASAEHLQLVTFDADGTLYEDGAHFEQNNKMIQLMMALLRANVHVAIVTAAGYPGNSERFEQRLAGLLKVLAEEQLPPHLCERFYVMVGL